MFLKLYMSALPFTSVNQEGIKGIFPQIQILRIIKAFIQCPPQGEHCANNSRCGALFTFRVQNLCADSMQTGNMHIKRIRQQKKDYYGLKWSRRALKKQMKVITGFSQTTAVKRGRLDKREQKDVSTGAEGNK